MFGENTALQQRIVIKYICAKFQKKKVHINQKTFHNLWQHLTCRYFKIYVLITNSICASLMKLYVSKHKFRSFPYNFFLSNIEQSVFRLKTHKLVCRDADHRQTELISLSKYQHLITITSI